MMFRILSWAPGLQGGGKEMTAAWEGGGICAVGVETGDCASTG